MAKIDADYVMASDWRSDIKDMIDKKVSIVNRKIDKYKWTHSKYRKRRKFIS